MIKLFYAGLASLALSATASQATPYEFTLNGWLTPGTTIGSGAAFTSDTPFTITALFDDTTTNLVGKSFPPSFGFVAYVPSSMTLLTGGNTYAVQPYDVTTHLGATVALFDVHQPFTPGRVAVGILQDPVADGTGIVADFLPGGPFAAKALTPTTFGTADFYGTGFGSGACISACRTANEVDAVTPLPMSLNGQTANLTLLSLSETYITHAGDPTAEPGPTTTHQWSASLAEVPEPATWAMLAAGFGAVGMASRRRLRGTVTGQWSGD